MGRMLCIGLALMIGFALSVPAVSAAGGNSSKPTDRLFFHEEDEFGDVVVGGAYGSMKYSLSGPEFVFWFIAHDGEVGDCLPVDTSFSLIYLPDVDDDEVIGEGMMVLAEGTSWLCCEGVSVVLRLVGSVDTGNLPAEADRNDGAMIVLVLSEDVGDGCMDAWNPTEYLFPDNLIEFDDTG